MNTEWDKEGRHTVIMFWIGFTVFTTGVFLAGVTAVTYHYATSKFFCEREGNDGK